MVVLRSPGDDKHFFFFFLIIIWLNVQDSELRESLRVEADPQPSSRRTGTPSRFRFMFRSNKNDTNEVSFQLYITLFLNENFECNRERSIENIDGVR